MLPGRPPPVTVVDKAHHFRPAWGSSKEGLCAVLSKGLAVLGSLPTPPSFPLCCRRSRTHVTI